MMITMMEDNSLGYLKLMLQSSRSIVDKNKTPLSSFLNMESILPVICFKMTNSADNVVFVILNLRFHSKDLPLHMQEVMSISNS